MIQLKKSFLSCDLNISTRNSQVRARESSVERSQRLAQQNLRTSELRARESRLERSQRLHEQNVKTSQLRERESSVEGLQRLRAHAERQQLSTNRVRNRILANSNRLSFRYDPQVDYTQTVQIGVMNKICSNCSAKKWADEPNGMCCASGISRLRRYRLAGGAARRVYNEVSGDMHLSF
ncbi:hypothetical protein J6590_068933 [Homalodisca vitripennis]|nr:hypothetical protein J6590_068933 [Homalodisca vitripennis]